MIVIIMSESTVFRLCLGGLGLALCLVFAAPSRGQTGINVEESKKHFQQGVDLFKKEKFREALDEFNKSYDLRPHWGILYNIGVCHLKLGKKAKSLMVLLQFMEKGGTDIAQETAAEVEDFIQDLMTKVGVVRFTGDISGARVLVDGEHIPEANENMYIYVDPGKRYIRVLVDGSVVFEDKINIKKGEEFTIDLGSKSQGTGPTVWTGPQPTPAFIPPVGTPLVDEGKPRKKPGSLMTAGWTMAGLTAAMLIGYAAAGGIALSEKNKMRDVEDEYLDEILPACDSGALSPAQCDTALAETMAGQDDHYDKAQNAKIAANVLFGLSLASLAVTIGLLVAGSKATRKEKPVLGPTALSLSPSGASLTLSF
jgi:hypothetical protein